VRYRIITYWASLLKYFLKSDHSKAIKDSSMFKRICTTLREGDIMLARLHFIHSLVDLYVKLVQLLRLLLQRFIKADALKDKTDAQLGSINLECQSVEICDFGAETMKLIRKLRRNNNPQCSLLEKDMQMFLRTSAKFLQERLPLNNVFLQNVRCLHPSQRMTAVGNQVITALLLACLSCPWAFSFSDSVVTDWRLYQADTDITAYWFISADGTNIPVDKYWSRVS